MNPLAWLHMYLWTQFGLLEYYFYCLQASWYNTSRTEKIEIRFSWKSEGVLHPVTHETLLSLPDGSCLTNNTENLFLLPFWAASFTARKHWWARAWKPDQRRSVHLWCLNLGLGSGCWSGWREVLDKIMPKDLVSANGDSKLGVLMGQSRERTTQFLL